MRRTPIALSVIAWLGVMSVHAQQGPLTGSQRSTVVPAWRHLLAAPPIVQHGMMDQAAMPQRFPSVFSYERLGLFCKAEYRLHRWLPVPVLVRIGDVERDEEVDGKGAYRTAW